MAIVCDYTDILFYISGGNRIINIGDFSDTGRYGAGIGFATGGRHTGHSAVLYCVYRRLTAGSVDVRINGSNIGSLSPLPRTDDLDNYWATAIFTFPGDVLRGEGFNSIVIDAIPLADPSSGDLFDDFQIKELVCFFKQET